MARQLRSTQVQRWGQLAFIYRTTESSGLERPPVSSKTAFGKPHQPTTTPTKHQVPQPVIKYCTCECKLPKSQSCKPHLSRRLNKGFPLCISAWCPDIEDKAPRQGACCGPPSWLKCQPNCDSVLLFSCDEKVILLPRKISLRATPKLLLGYLLWQVQGFPAEVEAPTSASLFSTAEIPVMQKGRICHVASWTENFKRNSQLDSWALPILCFCWHFFELLQLCVD